jgi:hypothetical protein
VNDLSVLEGDERDEAVVIGCACADELSVAAVFEDDDVLLLVVIDAQVVGAVQSDGVSVAAVELDQGSPPRSK